MMILGIDAGNNETKIVGPNGPRKFNSTIGEYKDRNLKDSHGADDMEFHYHNTGRKGNAGTLAQIESKYGASRKGITKANEDVLIRVLLALHLYSGGESEFGVVTGQPIKGHTKKETDKIREMLTKEEHTITVNGKKKKIKVVQCSIAPEGAVSGLLHPQKLGKVRVVDIGSGTVNLASLLELHYVNKESDTIPRGMTSMDDDDECPEFARTIVIRAEELEWNLQKDYIRCVGGGAEKMFPFLSPDLPNAELYKPDFNDMELDPVYANAVAFYEIARKLYG